MNRAFRECQKYYCLNQSAQLVSINLSYIVGYLTTLSVSQTLMVSGGRDNDQLLRIWKEAVMTYSRYYHGIIGTKFRDIREALSLLQCVGLSSECLRNGGDYENG